MPKPILVRTLNGAGVPNTALASNWLASDTFGSLTARVPLLYSNVPSVPNANAAVDIIDAALHANTDKKKTIVAWSMGAQMCEKWLREEGPTSDVDPEDVEFILTGNPERKYNGVMRRSPLPPLIAIVYGGVGHPDNTPYKVTDVARQYDFYADHPNDRNNLVAVKNVDPLWNPPWQNFGGLGLLNPMHQSYTDVRVDAAGNSRYVEGNTTYVVAPSFPMPGVMAIWQSPVERVQYDAVFRFPGAEKAYGGPVPRPALPARWTTQLPRLGTYAYDTKLKRWVKP